MQTRQAQHTVHQYIVVLWTHIPNTSCGGFHCGAATLCAYIPTAVLHLFWKCWWQCWFDVWRLGYTLLLAIVLLDANRSRRQRFYRSDYVNCQCHGNVTGGKVASRITRERTSNAMRKIKNIQTIHVSQPHLCQRMPSWWRRCGSTLWCADSVSDPELISRTPSTWGCMIRRRVCNSSFSVAAASFHSCAV